ncbi:ELL factor, partial [Urocolius indicus]|nr:ELL factor [Urocolius indicus]
CAYFSIRKYKAIVSPEQHQSYQNDFNAEYDEYLNLHSQLESISRRFKHLEEQWKLLSPDTNEYQVKKDRTVKDVFHLSSVL